MPHVQCPYCKHDETKVIDSRNSQDFSIRRRRECLSCERRFTTYEKIEESPIRVIKKDGTRVPFDRVKIRRGVEVACYKRPVSPEQIDLLVGDVEAALYEDGEREVPSRRIGELVRYASTIVAEAFGHTIATITVATPLAADQTARLEKALSARYGTTIRINELVDPAVLGGMRVQIGDDVIDGSIATRLTDLRLQLA